MRQFLLFAIVLACPLTASAQPLSDSVYDALKANFLNLDSQYFSEIDLNSYYGDSSQDFPDPAGLNVFEGRINEGGAMGWYTYGGTHWCQNSLHGTWSLCRYMTGGSSANNEPTCGSSVSNDYQTALSCSACICNQDQWSVGSGSRFWIGAGSNSSFILQFFSQVQNGPANRLCVEFELPTDRMRYSALGDTREDGDSERAQLLNPEVSHDNLDWLRLEWGTYTSVFHDDNSTSDEETGGTYQAGGSHFYHKASKYMRYPLDRVYAISANTFVACLVNAPAGVRSGMRPPYYANPLLTVVGENATGETHAYAYVPYLARVYFDVDAEGMETMFPAEVKYNKIFALYERNNIQALSGNGAVLGVDIVETGQTATYPFAVYNEASEARTYRIIMQSGDNLALNQVHDSWRIYVDDNANKQKDSNETTELIPASTITLQANTDLHLVGLHNPESKLVNIQRYSRSFAHAGITLQQLGRLRLTSYQVRTFIGTAEDVQNKATLLPTMVYPESTSDYATYAQWNHEKASNLRLLRNTPDYQMGLAKLRGTDPGAPAAPQNLRFRN